MMKKNVIALLLAAIMASSSIGAVPALAAETTAEEAVELRKKRALRKRYLRRSRTRIPD